MNKRLTFLFILIISLVKISFSKAENKFNSVDSLKSEVSILKDRTEEIRNGQLNYSIEKDLLEKTYNANYERLNILITAILGLAAILTFFGIRDINSIKRDFKQELETMRGLKSEFETKSKNFDIEKERFDSEIKKIITQNEEQNNKIKILELKEKVKKLMEEKQNVDAYDYCIVALEISPNDPALLNNKAILLCRLNNFNEAVENFERLYKLDPKNMTYAGNYIESLFFINKPIKAREILNENDEYFKEKTFMKLFDLIENYFTLDEKQFKSFAETLIDFKELEIMKNQLTGWALTEANSFIHFQPASTKKIICQNMFWYLEGLISGKTTCAKIDIPIPKV